MAHENACSDNVNPLTAEARADWEAQLVRQVRDAELESRRRILSALLSGVDGEARRKLLADFVSSASPDVRQQVLQALLEGATAELQATAAEALLSSESAFMSLEAMGFHLTRTHYYSPIPTLAEIDETLWERHSDLVGLDLNVAGQLQLLEKSLRTFAAECTAFATSPSLPTDFYFGNQLFDGTDATVLYCMVRYLRPRTILEVGSGFSTRLMAAALLRNDAGQLVSVDPYPEETVARGFFGLSSVIREKVENLDMEAFSALEAGDILFIDSSHVARIGGDVTFLFLEVVPRLKPGVVVHVHDVFFPDEYPREWIMEHHYFWNEQYLVQAFLAFNDSYEVLIANNYLGVHHHELLRETFPMAPWWGGGSLWIRRR